MVPFRVLSRTNLAYRSHHSGLNPRPVKLLQPLVPLQKSQLLWNQTNPASFCKTSGVGGTPSATRPLHRSAKMPLCKSFPCHSYANTRDGGVTVAPVSASVSLCLCGKPNFVRPLFSYSYELLFPQLPCFDTDPNSLGCVPSTYAPVPHPSCLH